MSILEANGAVACAECGRQARAVRDRLKVENERLRELVRDWHALATGGADSLTDWNHEQADLERRMRELGVDA